eukprot:1160087-Pelagomonas_calceolata.AAC.6
MDFCQWLQWFQRKKYVGRGNYPYINQVKGDTLAQKSLFWLSRESPSPQNCKKNANEDLEGYWKRPVPKPGCEDFQKHA